MCDNNQPPTGNQVVPGVRQMSGEVNSLPAHSQQLNNNGQSFYPGSLLSSMYQQGQQQQQQQQNDNPSDAQLHQNFDNDGMDSQYHPHHFTLPPHNMHPMPGNGCTVLQHHLLDNHHHHHHHHVQQQMNLAQQHPHLHHGQLPPAAHPHNNGLSQHAPYLPFGMGYNGNNGGNGGSYSNNATGNNTPMAHHQFHQHLLNHGPTFPNQHPAHAMGLTQYQRSVSCAIQHAACNHPQPGSVPQSGMNPQRQTATVGWMNGSSVGRVSHQNPISRSQTNNTNNGNGPAPAPSQGHGGTKPRGTMKVPPAGSGSEPMGLDVLWRELHPDYRNLFVPQDIPDTARFRGYFTVGELLVLKRQLKARHATYYRASPSPMPVSIVMSPATPVPTPTPLNKVLSGGISKGEGVKGTKRVVKDKSKGTGKVASSSKKEKKSGRDGKDPRKPENDSNSENCPFEEPMEQQDGDDKCPEDEQMVTKDSLKVNIETRATAAVTGVGVGDVVKETRDALSSTNSSVTPDNQKDGGEDGHQPETGISSTGKETGDVPMLEEKDSDSEELYINESGNGSGGAETLAETEGARNSALLEQLNQPRKDVFPPPLLPLQPALPLPSLFLDRTNGTTKMETTPLPNLSECYSQVPNGSSNIVEIKDEQEAAHERQKRLLTLAITATNEDYMQIHGPSSNTEPGTGYPTHFQYTGPVPPRRTATLVFKLLQIGPYHIRSFSSSNPNRLRVLFNTQRMIYECQLPIAQEGPLGSEGVPGSRLRKVLTVDIGFEQISMLRFATDSMWMRVEGAPLLTMSPVPAPDEDSNEMVTPQDQFLLDQIEKGQLKLSPVHQLFFLNERLVNQLEAQLRSHPKFGPMMVDNSQQF